MCFPDEAVDCGGEAAVEVVVFHGVVRVAFYKESALPPNLSKHLSYFSHHLQSICILQTLCTHFLPFHLVCVCIICSNMTIKIYGMPYSTCVARVLATLAEKEVEDYEIVPVDLSVGAHKKPEFLKMQVLCSVLWTLCYFNLRVSSSADF